jgi:tryptophan-rich sensory protein
MPNLFTQVKVLLSAVSLNSMLMWLANPMHHCAREPMSYYMTCMFFYILYSSMLSNSHNAPSIMTMSS